MPYFFILPLFALWLLLGVASSVGLRFTRWRRWAPYAWAITLGSLLGFVAGNAVLLLATGLAALVFVGPFAASALGALGGAGAGALLLYALRRKMA
jgi:hypothetical protein